MDWTIESFPQRGYSRLGLRGDFSRFELVTAYSEVISRPLWGLENRLLVDDRQMDVDTMRTPDVDAVSIKMISLEKAFESSKIAFFAPDDEHFGLCRQFQSALYCRLPAEIGVFRDEELATGWLLNRTEQKVLAAAAAVVSGTTQSESRVSRSINVF